MPNEKRARHKAARREKLETQRRADKRRQLIRRVSIVAIVAAVVVTSVALISSSGNAPSTSTTSTTVKTHGLTQEQVNSIAVGAGCPASPAQTVNSLHWSSAPAMTIDANKAYYAHVESTEGVFVIKLNAKVAPLAVNNFVFLADHKYFNCVTFHRVIKNFVIQGGDPTGTGSGGPGYSFADELPTASTASYPLYSVAMANSGPNTNGSQFFIISGTDGERLPPNYSLFGQVISGVRAINFMNDQGGTNANNGVPPAVINRMLKVTITSTP